VSRVFCETWEISGPHRSPHLKIYSSLQDAPISFYRQDDYLVRCHRFAMYLGAVQPLCKNRNNSARLWIKIDFATPCTSGYAQV
jgi:hypothetical protein